MRNARALVGTHDVLMMTIDTLRYDVACQCLERGRIPNLEKLLPDGRWECRHSPGNFTYSAHQAFFAGFLPTPATPGPHPRLFALAFDGSETITSQTCVFDAPDIVTGMADRGYHTVCIGGVGFFNKRNALGKVLPGLFAESHWTEEFGVRSRSSTENQVSLARTILRRLPPDRRVFLFMNVSATHQPNCIFVEGASEDTPQTQAAALEYVDQHIGVLAETMRGRAPVLGIICSDHGTAYGEDGYQGHRLSHPVIWTVPYAEFVLPMVAGSEA